MPSIITVRKSIVEVVTDKIPRMNGYADWADVTNVPAIVVGSPKADFAKAFNRGVDEWTFPVYVLVGVPEIGFAQEELDIYVSGAGIHSVREIIYKNSTLNDVVEDSMITKMDGYGGVYESPRQPLIPHVGACLYLTAYFAGG